MKLGFEATSRIYHSETSSWDQPLPDLDSEHTFITCFGSTERTHIQSAIDTLRQKYPKSCILGCSTAGEIYQDQVTDASLSVGIARFAYTRIKQSTIKLTPETSSFDVGRHIATDLNDPELRAIFILSEGLNVNGTDLIKGVNSVVSQNVTVTGGLAGDGSRFEKTWVLAKDLLSNNLVTAVGLYGSNFEIHHGSQGGWDSFGPIRKVTKSTSNVLHELDGEPALAVYEKYLGPRAKDLPSSGLLFPLAIRPEGEDKVLVRTLLAIDREAQTMTFAGDIPTGATAQLMKAHLDRLVDGAEDAALAIKPDSKHHNMLTIAVSCVGRRLVLGDRTEDELEVIVNAFKMPNNNLVGFYSYGELSPTKNGRCDLHNQTMTLTTIYEPPLNTQKLRNRLSQSLAAIKPPSVKKTAPPEKIATPRLTPPKIAVPSLEKQEPTPLSALQITPSNSTNHSLSYDLATKTWSAPFPSVDSERTLVLIFGAPEAINAHAAFQDIYAHYPKSHVIGCSGSGEIMNDVVHDGKITLLVKQFARTPLKSAYLPVSSASESFNAGKQLAEQLNRQDLRAIFILSEGLNVNGTDLVRGVNSIVDQDVTVTGGLAGDGSRFEKTWIYAKQQIRTHAVAAIGFYGDHVMISHGSQGGWDSFGPVRKVTKSEGNVLYELDGKPALALYKAYLGDKASELPASGLLFPISLVDTETGSRNVVRTLLSVDHDAQSLTFAGDIPQNASVQLMKAHLDRLIDGAQSAAELASTHGSEENPLAIAVSCVGRRLVLGTQTEDELDVVLDVLPETTTMAGFYSYGELSPTKNGRCDLHNQTMTLTIISERTHSKARPVPTTLQDKSTAIDFDKTIAVRSAGFMSAQLFYSLDDKKWSSHLPSRVNSPKTMVLAFCAPEAKDHPEVFKEIEDAFPDSHVIGCSSSGEIANKLVNDKSVSLAVARFSETTMKNALVTVSSASESFNAGKQLAEQLNRQDLRAIFILSEGLNVNGTDLVRGVNSIVDQDVTVTGGLAGDGSRFEKTWIYAKQQIRTHAVAAIGFYGDHVMISHGSQGGWDSFGPVRKVTKSEGNVLYELDGKPALALYKAYLGDKASELPASGLLFPISLVDTETGSRNVVRTLLSVDHDAQSLTFAGDIPQNASVQLMKAHLDRLIDGAQSAAELASTHGSEENPLAIAVSCVGRRLVLGTQTEDELDVVLDVLPETTTMAGFYSYGELSPTKNGRCDLHNQTMTLTLFGESPDPVPRRKMALSDEASDATKIVLQHNEYDDIAVEEPQLPALAVREPEQKVPVRQETPTPPAKPMERTPVSTPSPHTPRVTIPLHGQHIQSAGLGIDIHDDYGVMVVRLQGKMDEKFQGAQLGRKLAGVVLIDLAEVFRITSFGVREWLAMLKAAKNVDEMYLVRCSDAIANQLATIRAFIGNATVGSFFAPYRCEHCGTSFNALLDSEYDQDALGQNIPPTVNCLRCNKETTGLDEDPEYFFSFVPRDFQHPAFIRQAIDQLPPMKTSEPVEKLIQDDRTVILINTTLDHSIRWRRLILDVDGHVVIDLSGAEQATSQGAELLVKHMKQNADDATYSLVRPPFEVLCQLHKQNLQVLLEQVELEGQTSNGTTRRVHTSISSLTPDILAQSPIMIDDAGERINLEAHRDLLYFLTGHTNAKDDIAVSLSPSNTLPMEAIDKYEETQQISHQKPDTSMLIKALPVVLLVAILGGVILWKVSAQDTAVQEPKQEIALASVANNSTPDDNLWSSGSAVRPAWTDLKAWREDGQLFITGKGVNSSEDGALKEAMKLAKLELITQLQAGLKGEPLYHVIQQGAPASTAQQLEILNQQIQGKLVLKRVESVSKTEGDQLTLFAKYSVSEESFAAQLEHYTQRIDTPDASFGVRFPTIQGPKDHDVVVVKSTHKEIQPGDVILSESQEPMYTLTQLRKKITSGEKQLSLVFESKGVAKSSTIPLP